MKTKYIAGLLLMGASVMTSCADFTEIDAKGNNLLATVNDLEMLLNSPYAYDYYNGVDIDARAFSEVCGDYIYSYQQFANFFNSPAKTATSIRLSWDEDGWVNNLPELTSSDSFYTSCYFYIGRVANPILMQIDGASGDESKKAAIKAEAYLIRAYFHYLAIQKFAPAYTTATAANTVGLVYLTEDMDIKGQHAPISMEDYYAHILADLEEAIKLDALPKDAINRTRFCKASLYAAKALVLNTMQRFDEAAAVAQSTLDIDNTLVDYNQSLSIAYVSKDDESPKEPHPVFVRPRLQFPEDYFTMYGYMTYCCLTPYTQSFIEPAHVYRHYLYTSRLGRNDEEAEKLSLKHTGESGYIITAGSIDNWFPPCALGTAQMYLILAENAIHKGNYDEAMGHLDKIRVNRHLPEMYTPLQGTNPDKATAIRNYKNTAVTEGLFSIWNFVNRKRWNQLGPDWEETINRTLCGMNMTLTPQSKLWVFPIPGNVISNNKNFKPFMN